MHLWRSEIVTPPEDLPVDVAFIRDKVIRVSNGDTEDAEIEMWIQAAVADGERQTGRAFMTQTRKYIGPGFPAGAIVLPAPPLIAVESVAYVDADGEDAELAVSPAAFQVVPSGRVSKAELWPLYGETWPTTRCQPDAVTVTYTCGYATQDAVPKSLIAGIGLVVGELYKLRSLSVHAVHNTPAVLDTKRFWPTVF